MIAKIRKIYSVKGSQAAIFNDRRTIDDLPPTGNGRAGPKILLTRKASFLKPGIFWFLSKFIKTQTLNFFYLWA